MENNTTPEQWEKFKYNLTKETMTSVSELEDYIFIQNYNVIIKGSIIKSFKIGDKIKAATTRLSAGQPNLPPSIGLITPLNGGGVSVPLMVVEKYNKNTNCTPVAVNGGIMGGFMYQNPCTGELVNQDGSPLGVKPNSTINRTGANTNTPPSNVFNYLGLGLLVGIMVFAGYMAFKTIK